MGLFDQFSAPQDASPGFFGTSPMDPRYTGVLGFAAGLMAHNPSAAVAAYANATSPEARLKQADLAQQIQLRNIALQQQQQEWALQVPLLKAMADRMNGGGASSAPMTSQGLPAIPSSQGGPLGSGTFGIPMGGQSASQPQGGASSMPGGTMFPGIPDSIALPTAAFGGFKALLPVLSKYNEPTDLMKTLRASGVPEGSPQWNQAMQANVTKNNYIAPVNARPGSIIRDPIDPSKVLAFNPQVPVGTTPQFGPDGSVVAYQPIGNAEAALALGERAKKTGINQATSSVVYKDGVPQFSTADLDVKRAAGGLPTATPTGMAPVADPMRPQAPQPGERAAILGDEFKAAQGRLANAKTPDEVQRAFDDISGLQREMKTVGATAPSATPTVGNVTPIPSLGAVPNADAAQKASADSMKTSYERLQSAGTTANSALDALNKMQDLAAKKWPYLQAGPLATHTTMISPDAAEYEKQRANVVALMAQQLGAGGTDAGRANISESVPDFGKPQSAIKDGLGTLQNQIMAQQIKRDFLTPVYQAGDSKKYTTLENQFDQHVSPSMVPLLTMQAGPQRAAALKAAAQDPATRARLTWAAENGLLK